MQLFISYISILIQQATLTEKKRKFGNLGKWGFRIFGLANVEAISQNLLLKKLIFKDEAFQLFFRDSEQPHVSKTKFTAKN